MLLLENYLSDRQPYIQLNDIKSSLPQVTFGVPRGSSLHLVLFNLYVCDMQDNISTNTTVLQCGDDTMFYVYEKVIKLQNCTNCSRNSKWNEIWQ